MLVDLTVKELLDKTASNEPVPGGGSISALNAAIAASLAEMVAGLTVGRKKYEDKEEAMERIIVSMSTLRDGFMHDIDADSDAYNCVFSAFKMPKDTEEQKEARAAKIEASTKIASEIPMRVARKACQMMDSIAEVATDGNQNAVTDACVAMMAARTATLGAILNVKINLGSLKDREFADNMRAECDKLEAAAIEKEKTLLDKIKEIL
jgi:formiminotetrahydrofolate cyclodeaminase